MKSMPTLDQLRSEIGNGCSVPAGFCVEALPCLQTTQVFTYFLTSVRKDCYQKVRATDWRVLVTPM